MDPLIGSALISTGASLLNGVGNIIGQSSANKQNIQLQQMQNEWNERMWRMNNEYNDPSAQMKRLTRAGYSPAFAANTITGGTSNAPAQGTQPAQVNNPYQNLGESFQQTSSNIINAYATESQTELNKVRADNETKETAANIILKGKQAGLVDAEREYRDIINSFQHQRSTYENELISAQIRTEWAKVQQLYSQAQLNGSQSSLNRANEEFIKLQTLIYPSLSAAQIFHLRTSAEAAWQHAVNETNLNPYQKSVLLSQKTYYANLTTNLRYEGDLKKLESDLSKRLGIPLSTASQIYGSTIQGISNVVGSFAGGAGGQQKPVAAEQNICR